MPYKDPNKARNYKREWAKQDRLINPEAFRRRAREYRKRHPERYALQRKRHYERNRNTILDKSIARYAKDPDKTYRRFLSYRLQKFGLSLSDYDKILENQGQKCPICRIKLTRDVKPSLDHCHIAGHFRAVLCLKCNSAIAMMNHSAHIARSAVQYLESETLFNEAVGLLSIQNNQETRSNGSKEN